MSRPEGNDLGSVAVEVRADLRAISADLNQIRGLIGDQLGRGVREAENNVQAGLRRIGGQLQGIGRSMSIAITAPIVGAGVAVFKMGTDFETAFTGVRKTVETSAENLEALKRDIIDLSTTIPTGAAALARIAELGGQLGVAPEAIKDFTRVIAQMAETTDLSADSAATSLAQLGNLMKVPTAGFEEMGNVIVHLGNKMVTTEAQLVDFALNLAPIGAAFRITKEDIFSFSAAMASLALNPEAARTAFQKTIQDISVAVAEGNKDLTLWAKTANMSVADFSNTFRTDAAEAIKQFVYGLGDVTKAGGDATAVLRDLGISEARQQMTLLAMATGADTVKQAFEETTIAMQQHNALQTEAAKRYEDVSSQLDIVWNRLQKVAIELYDEMRPALVDVIIPALHDLVDMVSEVGEYFKDLSPEMKAAALGMAGLAAAIGPVLFILGSLAFSISSIIGLGGALGLTGVATAAGGAGVGLISLGTTMAALSGGAIVALGAGAGYAIGKFINWGVETLGLTEEMDSLVRMIAHSIPWFGKWATGADVVTEAENNLAKAIRDRNTALKARGIDVPNQEAWESDDDYTSRLQRITREQGKRIAPITGFVGPTLPAPEAPVPKVPLPLTAVQQAAADKLISDAKALKLEIENLNKAFQESLVPANTLNATLLKLSDATDAEILSQYGDEIVRVVEEQILLGENIPPLINRLYEQQKAVNDNVTSLGFLETAEKELAESKKDLAKVLKDNQVEWNNTEVAVNQLDSTYMKSLLNLGKLRLETLDTGKAIGQLRDAGFDNKTIMAMMGDKLKKAAENAKALGIELDPVTKELIELSAATEAAAQAAEDWQEIWVEAMGKVVSDFGSAVSSMILEGEKFSTSLKGIFKSLADTIIKTLVTGAFTKVMSGFANMLASMGGGKGGLLNSLGGLLGGSKGGAGILGSLGLGANLLTRTASTAPAIAGGFLPVFGGAGGAAGAGGLSGALGSGAGSIGLFGLSGAATLGIGAAVAGAVVLALKLTGRGRKRADEFVQTVENPFGDALGELVDSFDAAKKGGTLNLGDAEVIRQSTQDLWDGFLRENQAFAAQGDIQAKVAKQSLDHFEEIFGGPNLANIFSNMDETIAALKNPDKTVDEDGNMLSRVSSGIPQTGLAVSASRVFADAVTIFDEAIKGVVAGAGMQMHFEINNEFHMETDLDPLTIRDTIMAEITTVLETGVRGYREKWAQLISDTMDGLVSTTVPT